MTSLEIIKYYVDLLIVQYNNKPKARDHVSALVDQVIGDQIFAKVRDAFDIETAVGAQLDVLAAYVGIKRRVNGLSFSRAFFDSVSYDEADPSIYQGLDEYADDPDTFFASYSDTGSFYDMNDTELRSIIKMRVKMRISDHSLASIDIIMSEFFGTTGLATDNGDMTLSYAFTPTATDKLPWLAYYTNSLPKPAGVELDVTGL